MTGNKAYLPGASYHGMYCFSSLWSVVLSVATVFAGKDASRALGKTSTKEEDAVADWSVLTDAEKKVLDDWVTFFSKRYNIVGVVAGATNME